MYCSLINNKYSSLKIVLLFIIIYTIQERILTEATTVGTKSDDDDDDGGDNETTLIVLSAPSVNDAYYAVKFTDIINYMINFANIVNGKDDVVIIVDKDTLPYFTGKVPSNILIQANVYDIWIRDFSAVIPTREAKFKYVPAYQTSADDNIIESSFDSWFSKNNLQYYKTSNLIIDGGNVVDNAAGTRAILTDRILRDNPTLTMATAKTMLISLLGVTQVAIIPELANDTTGHADGMMMWASDNRILMTEVDEPFNTQIKNELTSSFPNVEIVDVPDYAEDGTWLTFISACNVYVNSIVTDDYIYMPIFNNTYDDDMLDMFDEYTNKTVVPVFAGDVCIMGGSARCLSWQVKGPNKIKIMNAAACGTNCTTSSSINISLHFNLSLMPFFIFYIFH